MAKIEWYHFLPKCAVFCVQWNCSLYSAKQPQARVDVTLCVCIFLCAVVVFFRNHIPAVQHRPRWCRVCDRNHGTQDVHGAWLQCSPPRGAHADQTTENCARWCWQGECVCIFCNFNILLLQIIKLRKGGIPFWVLRVISDSDIYYTKKKSIRESLCVFIFAYRASFSSCWLF